MEANRPLLCMPQWFGWQEIRTLPLPVDAYVIREEAPDWFEVSLRYGGEMIYSGIGPVEVVQSPAWISALRLV